MNRRYAAYLGGTSALLGLSWPLQATAAGDGRLQYDVPDGCPTQAEFESAVATRGGRFERQGPGEETFTVAVTRDADGYRASLTVQRPTGSSNPREVQAPSCAEVVDALAVVTAIALSSPAPTEGKPAAGLPAPVAPHEPARRALHGSADVWSKTLDVDAGKLHLDHALSITAFAGPVFGLVAKRAIERLDVTASRANFVTVPSGDSYLLGTIVRLRASLLFDQTYRFGNVQSQVGGQEVGASLCFSPHYDTAGWVLLGCAEISAGLIGVRITDATGAVTQNKTQGFGSVGLALEPSYNFATHFQLGLRLGAQALTSPITGERPDGSELFRSSPALLSGMLGVGVHF